MAKRKRLNDLEKEPGDSVAKREGRTRGLRSGNPGNKGGHGQPPKEYRLRMRALLASESHRAALEAALSDPTSSAFVGAMTHAAKYGYGVPAQRIEVEDTTPKVELTPELLLARLAEMKRNMDTLGAPTIRRALPTGEAHDDD